MGVANAVEAIERLWEVARAFTPEPNQPQARPNDAHAEFEPSETPQRCEPVLVWSGKLKHGGSSSHWSSVHHDR